MKKSIATTFLVLFTLLFQSVSFAMPCCYGMSSTASESISRYLESTQAQQVVMSDCGHEMIVEAEHPESESHSSLDDMPCPMSGVVSSSTVPPLLTDDLLAFQHPGKNVLSGSFLTLVIAPSPFLIDRPPRLS